MRTRPLSPEEAALWARVMAGVRPIAGRSPTPIESTPMKKRLDTPRAATATPPRSSAVPAASSRPPPMRTEGKLQLPTSGPANTLDGTWDRQLSRGIVAPDRTIDLHGHTLGSAYDVLDAALAAAIQRGERVLLLVTGKPPRAESERPHARGAIRAATGDWLAGSRHAAAIAAVRAAHPRHGGAGALYIVLKRPRPATPDSPKS